jgi:L-threonylcarbamoyladenylate synthase
VYGLLALPRSTRARGALARLKGRPGPFIVLIRTWEEARSWTRGVDEALWTRLHRVWPGPVTVILPTATDMPGSQNSAIGLRMPESRFLVALLEAVGEPLFSTSANPPGATPPLTAAEAVGGFPQGIALVLDGGPAGSREPSTIVDLSGPEPRLTRAGRGDARALLDPDRSPP